MAKVTDVFKAGADQVVFICDFSPPRGANLDILNQARYIDADFIDVAYNPGRSVRVNSVIAAYEIKRSTGKDVIFNLITRDTNKLGTQSLLMGAQILGLENVVVAKGDSFTDRELEIVSKVDDFSTTGLTGAIASMNMGEDYRGVKFRLHTDFCVGCTMDLSRGVEREATLTYRKVQSSAQFFVVQSVFDVGVVKRFQETYARISGGPLQQPIFYGLQILEKDGVVFTEVPDQLLRDLRKGRSAIDIALEILHNLVEVGVRGIYLIPPVRKGGLRDYESAQTLISEFKASR